MNELSIQKYNIETVKNDYFRRRWKVVDENDNDFIWSTANITQADLEIRNSNGLKKILLSTNDNTIELNTGEIILESNNINIAADLYDYELQFTDSNNYTYTRIGGKFNIVDDQVSSDLQSFAYNSNISSNQDLKVVVTSFTDYFSLTLKLNSDFNFGGAVGVNVDGGHADSIYNFLPLLDGGNAE